MKSTNKQYNREIAYASISTIEVTIKQNFKNFKKFSESLNMIFCLNNFYLQ